MSMLGRAVGVVRMLLGHYGSRGKTNALESREANKFAWHRTSSPKKDKRHD